MASSDEEGEIVPQCVTDYYLVSTNESPVSLSILPLQLSDGVGSETFNEQVYLRGTVDSGIRTIFKEVTAWKFELSYVLPEVFVLAKSKNWIKLQKPKKSYENIVRTIMVTIYCMHLAKKTPDASATSIWNNLRKFFSTFESGPSERDMMHHIPIISAAVSVDNDLIRSKYLLNILKWSYGKEVMPFEKAVPIARKKSFIVDDDDDRDAQENEDCEDEMDELFDRVCSFCDDGGELLCCEGRCLRSFHPTKEAGIATGCESLGFLSDAQVKALSGFQCQNCREQRHQCFVCGRLGSSDIASGAEVFPCISATCGHFYHPACVAKLIHSEDTTKAADLHNQIAKGESFTCPAHRCSLCKKVEDRTIHELQFAICRRCPIAYHRKCMPKGISFECPGVSSTRAWEGLLKNRVLIYCLKHKIDPELKTPERNHILLSDTQRSGMRLPSRMSSGRMEGTKRDKLLYGRMDDTKRDSTGQSKMILPQNTSLYMPKQVNSLSKSAERGFSQTSSSPRSGHNISFARTHPSDYTVKSSLAKAHCSSSSTDARRHLSGSSELVEQLLKGNIKPQSNQRAGIDNIRIKTPEMICTSSSWSNKAVIEARIAALKKKSDESFNEKKFRSKISVVSTHSSDPRIMLDKTIPQGRVEASVKAVQAALRKLEEGGTLEEAKAVCEPQILNQIKIWKRKLQVYLAPFLHGMRYTSYGRHFTKFEKLQEVVNRLHNYVVDGDTIVDFCCGSNDFSCLMKKKLDEMGKCCSFRNYDIIQPKNDFCFENRDWMSVTPKELPAGSKLVMGLNPPFGVKASLANKFINKALEFKPKLIILIVPEETKRLDDKCAYDLIWEDRKIFSGKAFYLPGSVDVHNKQIEQWNNSPPPLYLWSHSDWSNKHRSIAKQHSHAFMVQGEANGKCDSGLPTISNYLMEETHECYEDFSHIVPDNVDMLKIFDDIPDPDYSDESESDDVFTTPAGECSAESGDIQVRNYIHSGSNRKESLSPEIIVLHGEESYLPVKKRVHHLEYEANSTPDLPPQALSDKSLIMEGSCLSQSLTDSKPSTSNAVHMHKIIKTTQGVFSSSQSVPVGRTFKDKEVNPFVFESVSQMSLGAPNVQAGVNFNSDYELIFSNASGPRSFDWQSNSEVQSYANVAPLQPHYTYGTVPHGNSMQNLNYYYQQTSFPQVPYVPQYMSSQHINISPHAGSVAPFFHSRYANDDDLPPIPGFGTTPSSHPRP